MEIINYLKEIYSGKDVWHSHVILFSIVGIITIVLLKLFASFGNVLFADFFVVPPKNHYEMFIEIFVLLFAILYLIGYFFQYIHSILFSDNANLIDFNGRAFLTFFRGFPMFIIWESYLSITFVIGYFIMLLTKHISFLYLYIFVIFILYQFMHIILVKFSANFKYNFENLNPLIIIKYVKKYTVKMTILLLEVLLLILAFAGIIILLKDLVVLNTSKIYSTGIKLLLLCLANYFICIVKFVYLIGITKFIKSNN